MDTRNEKSVLKVAKRPSLRPLALESEFLQEFEFLKNYKDLYGERFLVSKSCSPAIFSI